METFAALHRIWVNRTPSRFSSGLAAQLRNELCARNAAFAAANKLDHVPSYGVPPVVVYAPHASGLTHGNFFDRSYAAILKSPEWSRRLEKTHTHSRRSLPRADRAWRELDSCMSSDALLMNIFCCPGVVSNLQVAGMLGTNPADKPELAGKRVFLSRMAAPIALRLT